MNETYSSNPKARRLEKFSDALEQLDFEILWPEPDRDVGMRYIWDRTTGRRILYGESVIVGRIAGSPAQRYAIQYCLDQRDAVMRAMQGAVAASLEEREKSIKLAERTVDGKRSRGQTQIDEGTKAV